jgi:type VI secretion system protein VasD
MHDPARRLARALLAACLAAWLSSCAGPAMPQRKVDITVLASAGLNPDGDSRPSPVVVRIYELADMDAFQHAGYFDLADRDKDVLGANAVARVVVAVRPGESLQLCRDLEPGSRHLAVMVAYRDIYRARWRSVVALPASEDSAWIIDLGPDNVAIRADSRPGAAGGASSLIKKIEPFWSKLSGAFGSMTGAGRTVQVPAALKEPTHVLEQ